MEYFKNLENIDPYMPQRPRTFKAAYEEHEENLLTYFEKGYTREALESLMFQVAQGFLGTKRWRLSDKGLKKLLDIKSKQNRDVVNFFRAYLLGKRAKEIYDQKKQPNNESAWTLLYQAGVHLGQFLYAKEKFKDSLHFTELAKRKYAPYAPAIEKMIELIKEKRPKDGWKDKNQMAESITPYLNEFMAENDIRLDEINAVTRNLIWLRRHEEIGNAYTLNSAKYLKIMKVIDPEPYPRYTHLTDPGS